MIGPNIMNQPENIVYVQSEVFEDGHDKYEELIDSKLFGLLEVLRVPKKIAGSVVHFVAGIVKSIGVRKLLKTGLLGALAVGLGSVGAAALAGLTSLISFVFTVIPYVTAAINFGLGIIGKDQGHQSHVDTVTDYAYNAFNQYEAQQYKA